MEKIIYTYAKVKSFKQSLPLKGQEYVQMNLQMSGWGCCLWSEGGLILTVRLIVDSLISLLPLLMSLHRSTDLNNGRRPK